MVAVETITGSVTIFELLGCEEVKTGENVTGDWDELYNQEIYNEARGEKLRVFIHESRCEVSDAIEGYFPPTSVSAPARRPMWPGRYATQLFHQIRT